MLQFLNRYLNPVFTISLVLFAALGYLLSSFFETTILVWNVCLLVSVIAAGGMVYALHKDNNESSTTNSSLFSSFLALLPYLIFIPSVLVFLQYPAVNVSFHGDIHAGYVNQILYLTGKPENPYLPTAPATYYWLYHALVASLTSLSRLPHPLTSTILNLLALWSLFGWIERLLTLIAPENTPRFMRSMLVIVLVFGTNLFGAIHSMQDMWENFNIWNIASLIAPISLSDTMPYGNLLEKFINYNSFPLVILYVWLVIYLAVKFIQGKAKTIDVCLFILAIGGATAFLIVMGYFIFGAVVSGILAIYLLKFLRPQAKLMMPNPFKLDGFASWQSRLIILLSVIVSLLLVANSLELVRSMLGNEGQSRSFTFVNFIVLTDLFGLNYPYLIFIILGCFIVWKKPEPIVIFSLIASLSAATVAYFFQIENYKLTTISHFFIILLSVYLVRRFYVKLEDYDEAINFHSPIILVLYLLVGINVLTSNASLVDFAIVEKANTDYAYEGLGVRDNLFPYQDVFSWARQNSPQDSLLVAPSPLGRFSWVLADRAAYVASGSFADIMSIFPERSTRLEQIQILMTEDVNSPEWQAAWDGIQVGIGERHRVYIFPNEAPANQADLTAFGLRLVYTGELAQVYAQE